MGKLFRRALSFVLGMVFGVTALAGGIVGGAYWAYKNVKPLELVTEQKPVDGFGELESASVEELLDLIADAVNNPDEYKIKRLEKEYGLDIVSLLKSAGINTDDANEVDINALRDISIFSLFGNGEKFLDSVKFRALYVFMPKILGKGKTLDDYLSPEAQNKLGEYSIHELFSKSALTNELGIVSALKNLKVGSVLPSIYDANYVRETHEYDYTIKEGKSKALGLIGNVYIGTLFDIANGSPIINEVMEGGLVSISELTIKEVIVALGSIMSEDMAKFIEKRADAFGEMTVSDLFEKQGDTYKFTSDKLLENMQVGYLLGYTKGEDGAWYTDEACTTLAEGFGASLAKANVKELVDNKNDTLKLINTAFGDVTFEDLVKQLGVVDQIPSGMKALYNITVSDIIGDGTNIGSNIRRELSEALIDTTLQDFLGLKPNSPVLESLYQIKVGQLLDPNLTAQDALTILQTALNGVAIGDLLGYERDGEGNWNCENKFLKPFLDVTFGEAPAGISVLVVMSLFADGNVTEMFQALFGDLSCGDVFAIAYKLYYDEVAQNWYKETPKGKLYLDEDFAKALHVKLWQLASVFDKNDSYVIYDDIKQVSVGEALYSILMASDKLPSGFIKVGADEWQYIEETDDGYALENSDVRQLSEIFFQVDVEELRFHRKDKEYWKEKLKPVTGKSVIGMFLTDSQEESNAVVKASLGVTVGDLLSLVDDTDKLSGRQALSKIIDEHYQTVILKGVETKIYVGDALQILTKKWRDNCTLEALGNLEFAKSARAILGTYSKREAFGHLTMEELFWDYIPLKLQKSDLVKATVKMTVANLFDIYKVRNEPIGKVITTAFHDVLEPLYEGLTIMEIVNDYRNYGEKLEAYGPILDIELNTILHAVHTKNFGTLMADFKTAFKAMNRREKIIVLGAGAGVVMALYEIDNPLLVTLLNSAFGDDTWGQYLGKRFGYTFDGEKYTINGVYNDLADKLFTQKISVTFDKTKVGLRKDYIDQVEIGHLVASHKKFFSLLDGLNKSYKVGKLASDENGIYLSGHFERLTRVVFDVKLIDIYRNRNNVKKYLVDTFGDLKLGDVIAGISQKVIKLAGMNHSYTVTDDGVYTSHGAFANITEKLYNTTLIQFKRENDKLVKRIIKEANVGDLIADIANLASKKYLGNTYKGEAHLTEDRTAWIATGNYDEFLNILYNLKVQDVMNGAKLGAKQYITRDDVFGKFKLGYIFAKGNLEFNEEGNYWQYANGSPVKFSGTEGALRKKVYGLTVGDIITPEGFKFKTLLEGLYVGEFIDYTCQDSVNNYGHVHGENCVWYEETSAVVVGQEDLGAQNVKVKLNALNQTIAGLEFSEIASDGFSLETIFKGNKLGDVIGFVKTEEQGVVTWYEPKKSESGEVLVQGENGLYSRVISDEPVSVLSATLADINASDLVSPDATDIIINKVKQLKLGDVLEYVEKDGVWYKKAGGEEVAVTGAMAKLANNTVKEIENDLDGIIDEWQLKDVLSEAQINSNPIIKKLADTKISDISSAMDEVLVGEAMGLEKRVDGKWYKTKENIVETDEIMLVLADYKIGQLTGKLPTESGKSFSKDVVDNMLNNVTLGTIYPEIGTDEADGFMTLLGKDWKLSDLSENLMEKLKTDTTIDQLIELGVFGEYFVPVEGYDNATTPDKVDGEYTNYGLIDSIFARFAPSGMTAREYWLSLTMPQFMNGIMSTVTVYQKWFADNKAVLEQLGVQLPVQMG